ncbi:HFL133Wp [Eremothecium sinecaudum]|uniref:HFL133Wp n=1 Tax=Eremothecium sinecaudum TaxID=45286 RepID=A0A120K2J1_9SACH|nr:HFL133Wp [Eremothecium sinecaudum]AMD21723.1 HFL133Wp [Eremothecium sinecaudum]
MLRQVIARSFRLSRCCISRRLYSTKPPRPDEMPKFRNLIIVSVIGTLIFIQAVNAVDKNKPKNSFSEDEYSRIMSGLKRKISIFSQGDITVHLVPSTISTNKLPDYKESKIIEVRDVAEYYRKQENDRYQALLDETFNVHKENYLSKLPVGTIAMLLGRYMKDRCQKGDTVYVVGFPDSIKEAIKFETEVSVVSSVISNKTTQDFELVKYFQTVDKITTI